MGAWGITVRQSDDGLDLLDTIVMEQLRKVEFAASNVSEAIALLNQTIQEEIEQYKQKPPSKITDFYISETLMHNFTNTAVHTPKYRGHRHCWRAFFFSVLV